LTCAAATGDFVKYIKAAVDKRTGKLVNAAAQRKSSVLRNSPRVSKKTA
jgi:hypothetical protein